MRIFILICISFLYANSSRAQLANGSNAPDFSITDINGNGWSLYGEMAGGRSACLDFSATWCSPCWSFHQSHVLDQVTSNLGAFTSVLFLEADFNTNTNCLYGPSGCVGGTQGNWVAGVNYPITDLSGSNGPGVGSQYKVNFVPTLYMISPDFRTWLNESRTYQEYYDWIVYSFALTATGNVANSSCGDNGSVLLDVTGGYGTRKYKWSNGATSKDLVNIPGGNYKVTITDDNGYFKTFGPWLVVGPQKRVAITSSSQVDVKCFGELTGAINITAAFGTPGYTYLWSNGNSSMQLKNIESGAYTVTVTDANNCTTTKSFFINQPPLLTSSLKGFDETCDMANGFISVIANGGVSPYLYVMGNQKNNSGSFQKLKGGTFTIEVIDYNKCKISEDITINATHKPTLVITAPEAISCVNDTILLNAENSDNGSEFIIEWTTRNGKIIGDPFNINISTAKTGTYQLKITNTLNQCVSIDSVVIKEDKKYPDISVAGQADLNCTLPETNLIGMSKNIRTNYYWTKLNSNFRDSSAHILVSTGGDYVFTVKDTINQCIAKDTVVIKEDKILPHIEIDIPKILNCKELSTSIDARESDQSKDIILQWFTSDGHFKADEKSLIPFVDQPGTYVLRLKNSINGCESIQTVSVQQDTVMPEVKFLNLTDLSCIRPVISLEFPLGDNKDFEYLWTTSNGHIQGAGNTYRLELDKGGDYNFYYKNINNHCERTIAFALNEQKTLEPMFDFQRKELELIFSDNTQGLVQSRFWQFGDGEVSSELNPTHIYAFEGQYEVCLEVNNECGAKKLCKGITLKNSTVLNLESWYLKPVSCFGGKDAYVKLNVKGGVSPYTYLWNNGETGSEIVNLEKGSYIVSITDALNSKIEQSFVVKEPAIISLESVTIKNENAGFKDGSIEVKVGGGVPGYTYVWTNGRNTDRIDQLIAGQYSLSVKDLNECEKSFGPFEVNAVTSNRDESSIIEFDFAPNPFSETGAISIQLNSKQKFSLQLCDNTGRILLSWHAEAAVWKGKLDAGLMVPGTYFLMLITRSGQQSKLLLKG